MPWSPSHTVCRGGHDDPWSGQSKGPRAARRSRISIRIHVLLPRHQQLPIAICRNSGKSVSSKCSKIRAPCVRQRRLIVREESASPGNCGGVGDVAPARDFYHLYPVFGIECSPHNEDCSVGESGKRRSLVLAKCAVEFYRSRERAPPVGRAGIHDLALKLTRLGRAGEVHPCEVYDAGWKTVARRIIRNCGLIHNLPIE